MRLIKLTVKSSISEEIIREIKFNQEGLSLIVDETNRGASGSNIGKTTAVKIIDLCLGAKSVSSIYKEKDTGENKIVKEFLEKKKIVAELLVLVGETEYIFKRSLYKNGKSSINNEVQKSIKEYTRKLNEIVFANYNNKPSFRELITKFVRLDNSNENSLLKYLGGYYKNYQYQAIYCYLYGLDISKSQNTDIISINETIDKEIESILTKNGVSTLEEFKIKIDLMEEELEKFKKSYSTIMSSKEYNSKQEEIKNKLLEINQLEKIVAKDNLTKSLMEEKIKKEEERIFLVDHKLLKKLYEETKLNVTTQLKDFHDLEQFHNSMVNKRIEMLRKSLKEMKYYLEVNTSRLNELREQFEKNYISYSIELNDKLENKFKEYFENQTKLETYEAEYQDIEIKLQQKEENLKMIVYEEADNGEVENIIETLKRYFKYYAEQIIGEPFALVLKLEGESFPVQIIGVNGKPGTGIKKALITCFDLAHISLIIEKKFHMPQFTVHDKLENIDLKELRNIIEVTKNFKGQYIFPILSDRIDQLNISEDEVVLRLSSEDKFFHI